MHRFLRKLLDALPLTPPEKPTKIYPTEFYVRDQRSSAPTTEEVLAVIMAVNARRPRTFGVGDPSEGVLTPRQYEILPEAVKRLFVKKTILLPPR